MAARWVVIKCYPPQRSARPMLLIEQKNFLGDLPTWVTAIATLLLAALAIFQDSLRRLLTRPKVELHTRPQPPECLPTEWLCVRTFRKINPVSNERFDETIQLALPCYYFRLRVTNSGNCEAREVEVFAKDLKRHSESRGEFDDVARFSPMNLLWADVRQPFLHVLSPKLPKLCDLAHAIAPSKRDYLGHRLQGVSDDHVILALDLQVEPNSKGHLLGPGFYRLTLVLAAANAPPREYQLDITITGDWYEEPDRMFTDGIRFRLREL